MCCSKKKKDPEIGLDHKIVVLIRIRSSVCVVQKFLVRLEMNLILKEQDYTDPSRRVDFRNKNEVNFKTGPKYNFVTILDSKT